MSIRPSRRPSDVTLRETLTWALSALPAGRYAGACVGVVAVVTLVVRSAPSVRIAVFGGTLMLAGMVLTAVVTRLTSGRLHPAPDALRRPAIVLSWVVVCAATVVLALLISTTFWGVPEGTTGVRGHGLGVVPTGVGARGPGGRRDCEDQ